MNPVAAMVAALLCIAHGSVETCMAPKRARHVLAGTGALVSLMGYEAAFYLPVQNKLYWPFGRVGEILKHRVLTAALCSSFATVIFARSAALASTKTIAEKTTQRA